MRMWCCVVFYGFHNAWAIMGPDGIILAVRGGALSENVKSLRFGTEVELDNA